jgi:23S rRNA pseudouridine1911/1915/1917 synthase
MDKMKIFCGEDLKSAVSMRLDLFLAGAMGRSRSQVQSWIRAGQVEVNGEPAPAKHRIRLQDEICVLEQSGPVQERLQPEAIALDVLFEDGQVLVLNKPPGLVVHPAAGNYTGTLVHALLHHCGEALANGPDAMRPGIVHRLDKDTSGVMVVAKTTAALETLSRQFASRTVQKTYQGLAWGKFRRTAGECRGAIGRHPQNRKKMAVLLRGGRSAHTDYHVLRQGKAAAWVECHLHTGRTHQIRVHLAALGHPLVGDALYGRARAGKGFPLPSRQMLHAATLRFSHPVSGKEVEFSAPLPEDFQNALQHLDEL